mmetsp:Transcript_8027/g.19695  ORF Transcript_8027/g.19695 Transcript_8027/m.19695 type:complete len:243 (-) Transcript_8027:573-1301(-)
MGVFLLTMVLMCFPSVSIPSDRGVTSSSSNSWLLASPPPPITPDRMADCTAAPYATASSGLMEEQSCLPPKKDESISLILGMRVEPPTSTTSSMSSFLASASFRTCRTTSMQLSNSREHRDSNLARVRLAEKSTPPAKDSTSISADVVTDSIHLAFSTAAWSLRMLLSPTSTSLLSFFHCLSRNATTFWSKSSPPRRVSPPVALTSNNPLSMLRIDTSKVPPPRSKMSTLRSDCPEDTRSRP